MADKAKPPAPRPVESYLQTGVILFGISRIDEDDDAQAVFDAIRATTDPDQLQRILLLIDKSPNWRAVLDRFPGTAADEAIILEPPSN